ncbi:hypothetical protein NFI96_004317 [Prochilodus magdalenae]|nr:hypothetical protein NFI96_004317 [Prochilodus magdalenae]
MGEGCGFVCISHVGVNLIQRSVSPCGAGDILKKLWKSRSQIAVSKVPCYYKGPIWLKKRGDKEELKRVQTELRIRIKEAKEEYRTKLETKLENNNTRDVWRGLKDITGFNLSSSGAITDGSYERANELNQFFLRFDNDSPTTTLSSAGSLVVLNLNTSPEQQPPPFTAHTSSIPNIYTSYDSNGPFTTPAQDQSSSSAPTLTADQVKKELKKLKQGKAAGPDGIQPKTLERLMLGHMKPLVRAALDPLQFAYQDAIGVDDAVIYLMDKVDSHLDTAGSAVRIMFFDFSSAFNTLQPVLLGEKLRQMQVDESIISWTMDYLTGRPQFVRMQGCVSDVAMCSTGAPQGTVLAPFLFNIYTSDFRYNSGTCHLQKFSDDTAILNISKTKEMVVDFRRNRSPQAPVTIDGEEVEVVGTYKYLGVHLDNKLDWSSNTSAVFKRGQSRLYFLRKLRSFGVCTKLLWTFYQSVVASAIFYSVVCWGNSINKTAINKLNKLVKKAGSVIGLKLDTLEVVAEKRTLNKLLAVMDNASHPLHCAVEKQRSTFSGRLRQLRCAKERRVRSFLPTAIRLYNDSSMDHVGRVSWLLGINSSTWSTLEAALCLDPASQDSCDVRRQETSSLDMDTVDCGSQAGRLHKGVSAQGIGHCILCTWNMLDLKTVWSEFGNPPLLTCI